MQEITGAKPVRDANFHAPKAFSAMPSLGKRVSPVQLRVGAPVFAGHAQASQSNQRSGRRHKPAGPGAAPGTARYLHAGHDEGFASMQQAADFFCKEILPGRHRLEAPIFRSCSPIAEARRRERRQCRCKSCREHQFHGVEATADRHRIFNPVW